MSPPQPTLRIRKTVKFYIYLFSRPKGAIKEFNVHKLLLLQASSEVFEAMISRCFKEGRSNLLETKDVDPNIFEILLKHIYGQTINLSSTEEAWKLYALSDQYLVHETKDFCLDFIEKHLDPENCVNCLETSEKFELSELKEKCVKMLQEKTDQIVMKDNFYRASLSTIKLLVDQERLNIREIDLFTSFVLWLKSFMEVKGEQIKDVIQKEIIPKFSYLSMSAEQFQNGPAKCDLLNLEEKYAILTNLTIPNCCDPLPNGFRTKKRIFLQAKVTEQATNFKSENFSHHARRVELKIQGMDLAKSDWRKTRRGLLEKIQYMFTQSKLTDVCIKIIYNDTITEFNVHKLLLQVSSEVFETMFSGCFKEGRSNSLETKDVDPYIFELLLKHIYGQTTKLSSNEEAWKLYALSDRYLVHETREFCLDFIEKHLDPENCVNCMETSEKFEIIELKEKCVKMLQEKTDQIVMKDNFYRASLSTIKLLVDQERLQISEIDLFTSFVLWLKSFMEVKGEQIKDVIQKEIIPKFSYLSMSAEQFQNGPAKCDLLNYEEKYAILTNLTIPNCCDPLPNGFRAIKRISATNFKSENCSEEPDEQDDSEYSYECDDAEESCEECSKCRRQYEEMKSRKKCYERDDLEQDYWCLRCYEYYERNGCRWSPFIPIW